MFSRLLDSSAFRLAAAYAALFSISAMLLLGFVYWSTAGFLLRQADETIDAEIRVLAERYRASGLAGLTDLLESRLSRQPAGSTIYLLADTSYRPLRGNLNAWPDAEPDAGGWIRFRLSGPQEELVRNARARVFVLRGGFRLLVGRDMLELHSMRATVVRTVLWGVALIGALALAGGLAVSRGRLRRLGAIDRTIASVMEGDLSRRVPEDSGEGEIARITRNLNRMLAELERLFDGVRRLSDNLAHDLRTPLARLKNRLDELAAVEDRDRAAHLIDDARAEADGLLVTFNALLRIAHIESGRRRGAFAAIDAAELIRDVAELYEPLFEDAGIDLRCTVDRRLPIRGDRDLLFQALTNLADNALKYAGRGASVELFASEIDGSLSLGVSDDGTGVPEPEMENIRQRFYRLDTSRNTPGVGLGLSLVSAVAHLHGGELELTDNHPGLRAAVRLGKISSNGAATARPRGQAGSENRDQGA